MNLPGPRMTVVILCIGLAVGFSTRSWSAESVEPMATVSPAAEPTPDQLRARIAQLEADLQAARLENGKLTLENARLRRLCEQAGIDPSAKPRVEGKPAAIPEDRIDPQVWAFLESARRQWDGRVRPEGNPGELTWPLVTGKIGTLSPYFHCEVQQVIDATNMLIRTAFAGDHSGNGLRVFWVSRYSTANLADGQQVHLLGVFRVKGTRQYDTAGGSTNTVFEMEPFYVNAYLANLAKGPPDAKPTAAPNSK